MDRELEIAKSIKAGTLELICPEMELLTCPSYEEVALSGNGVIRTDNLGRLYFRLISTFRGAPHASLQPHKRAGVKYAAREHLMLRAIDEGGREWRSNWMIVDVSTQFPFPNYRIKKNLGTIAHWANRPKTDRSFIQIFIPGAQPLPFDMVTEERRTVEERDIGKSRSVDHHSQSIGQAEVSFRQEGDGWLCVSAAQDGVLMPTWPGLMCQALEFATVQAMNPAVITRVYNECETLSLHSGPFWRFASQMPPPVDAESDGGTNAFWSLIEVLFRYLDAQPVGDIPLIDELEGIRRGARGSFQTACLTLGMGIESIARLLLKGESTQNVAPEVLRSLIDHIDGWPGDARVKERAKGAASHLADTSATDLMYAWVTRTGTSEELLKAWKKVRHRKAHGGAVGEEQAGFDSYYSAVELLYRIIASAIAYDGPILPTSQRGWGLDSEVNSKCQAESPTTTQAGGAGGLGRSESA
jgi:hypothetical protein